MVMNPATELTLEQEFSLRLFAEQVQYTSLEQAQELLIEQQRLMMLRDAMYLQLMKHEWNL
jgi:Phycobilisome degradation protein nblA